MKLDAFIDGFRRASSELKRHPNWVQDIVEYWNELSDKYWR